MYVCMYDSFLPVQLRTKPLKYLRRRSAQPSGRLKSGCPNESRRGAKLQTYVGRPENNNQRSRTDHSCHVRTENQYASTTYHTVRDEIEQNWNKLTFNVSLNRSQWETSSLLKIRPSRCVTVGDRSFATAGPRLWNSLPADVRSASSVTTFRQMLKKLIYFGNLTPTLLHNCVAIVFLEVTFT